MKKIIFLALVVVSFINAYSYEQRDILQKESAAIGLSTALVKDFSEIGFPDYKNRNFWNDLPEVIIQQYVEAAEKYLNYDWPAVKATDYLEIIRSGDRRQGAYAAPSGALQSLVIQAIYAGRNALKALA